MHTGSCLCGAIRFTIADPLAPIQLCHCGQCRKAQGAAFAANVPVAADAFRFTAGEEALRTYESSPGKVRAFCGRCASPIFSRRDTAPEVLRIRAGVLDAPVQSRPDAHAFTADKADWWAITDALPQHPGPRPA